MAMRQMRTVPARVAMCSGCDEVLVLAGAEMCEGCRRTEYWLQQRRQAEAGHAAARASGLYVVPVWGPEREHPPENERWDADLGWMALVTGGVIGGLGACGVVGFFALRLVVSVGLRLSGA